MATVFSKMTLIKPCAFSDKTSFSLSNRVFNFSASSASARTCFSTNSGFSAFNFSLISVTLSVNDFTNSPALPVNGLVCRCEKKKRANESKFNHLEKKNQINIISLLCLTHTSSVILTTFDSTSFASVLSSFCTLSSNSALLSELTTRKNAAPKAVNVSFAESHIAVNPSLSVGVGAGASRTLRATTIFEMGETKKKTKLNFTSRKMYSETLETQ